MSTNSSQNCFRCFLRSLPFALALDPHPVEEAANPPPQKGDGVCETKTQVAALHKRRTDTDAAVNSLADEKLMEWRRPQTFKGDRKLKPYNKLAWKHALREGERERERAGLTRGIVDSRILQDVGGGRKIEQTPTRRHPPLRLSFVKWTSGM